MRTKTGLKQDQNWTKTRLNLTKSGLKLDSICTKTRTDNKVGINDPSRAQGQPAHLMLKVAENKQSQEQTFKKCVIYLYEVLF